MTFFGKMKAYYVNLAYLKLESGLNMRVTILDRSRRQRVKAERQFYLTIKVSTFVKQLLKHSFLYFLYFYVIFHKSFSM